MNERDPKSSIFDKIPGGPIKLMIIPVAAAAGFIIGGIPGAVAVITIEGIAIILIRPKAK